MYKVNCIAISLKNQKTAKYGELVESKQLDGNAEDMAKQGFIIKATKEDIEAFKKSQKPATKKSGSGNDDLDLTKPVSQMKTAELEAKAKEVDVDISKAANNNERAAIIQKKLDANERQTLEGHANELKVEFDENTSNDDLKKAIEEAKSKE